jgi:hypothetical protein
MCILHCDLWSPHGTIAESGASYLFSAMYNLAQFVVSVPATHMIHAYELTRILFTKRSF